MRSPVGDLREETTEAVISWSGVRGWGYEEKEVIGGDAVCSMLLTTNWVV